MTEEKIEKVNKKTRKAKAPKAENKLEPKRFGITFPAQIQFTVLATDAIDAKQVANVTVNSMNLIMRPQYVALAEPTVVEVD